nr:MAG TPA: nucleocapsid protein [Microviridae sp.]
MSLPEGKAIYLIAFSLPPCLICANSQTSLPPV